MFTAKLMTVVHVARIAGMIAGIATGDASAFGYCESCGEFLPLFAGYMPDGAALMCSGCVEFWQFN